MWNWINDKHKRCVACLLDSGFSLVLASAGIRVGPILSCMKIGGMWGCYKQPFGAQQSTYLRHCGPMHDPSTHPLPHHTNTSNEYQNYSFTHCLTHTPPNDSDKAKGVYNPMKCNEALAYHYQNVNYPVKYTCRWKGRRDFKEKSVKRIVGINQGSAC